MLNSKITLLLLTTLAVGFTHAYGTEAPKPPTPCEVATNQTPGYESALKSKFNLNNALEAQQQKIAQSTVDSLKSAITAKDNTKCSNLMLVLNQLLKVEAANQVSIGTYKVPVKIEPFPEPYDCYNSKTRVPEYQKLAKDFGENKFVPDVILPRLPKLQDEVTAMDKALAQAKLSHTQEHQQRQTRQAQELSRLSSSQDAAHNTFASKISAPQKTLTEMKAAYTKILGAIPDNSQQIAAAVANEVGAMATQLESMFPSIRAGPKTISNLATSLSTTDRKKTDFSVEITTVTNYTSGLNTEKEALKPKLKETARQFKTLQKQVANFSGKIAGSLPKELEHLHDQMKSLSSHVNDLNKAFNSLLKSQTDSLDAMKGKHIQEVVSMVNAHTAAIQSIWAQHDPTCSSLMKPIEDMVKNFAKSPLK